MALLRVTKYRVELKRGYSKKVRMTAFSRCIRIYTFLRLNKTDRTSVLETIIASTALRRTLPRLRFSYSIPSLSSRSAPLPR